MIPAPDPSLRDTSCVENPALQSLLRCNRICLLQGPVGPFFDRLATALQQRGAVVSRVAFHGGDLWDSRAVVATPFQGHPSEWRLFLRELLIHCQIDGVVLFGETRSHHEVALEVCGELGVLAHVFEEGYFRPGYATLEHDGVNARSSSLSRHTWGMTAPRPPLKLKGVFGRTATFAMAHYLAMSMRRSYFPHHRHHRSTSVALYARFWVFGWLQWLARIYPDRAVCRTLGLHSRPYFFIPLQFHEDSQIRRFSPFLCNRGFLTTVLKSFAAQAPKTQRLVIKQHPHARGLEEPKRFLEGLSTELGISGRVHFLVEGSVGKLVARATGVVTVNSTTGLLALGAGVPLFTLGDSVYAKAPGVDTGDLDSFWANPRRGLNPNSMGFIRALKGLTQVPIDLYATRHEPLEL